LICMGAFVYSYLPDSDNIAPFKNSTLIIQNKIGKMKERTAN